MTEESEEVLIENRVTASGGVKEGGIEVSVCEEHGNACC